MGKILTATYKDSVEKVTGFYDKLVNNPFYIYNDSKPTICRKYFNINKTFTSVDPGSKLVMDNIGSESPIRYNQIDDLIIYGFNKIQLQSEIDEFGLESNTVTGDCIIIPNEFVPTEGDYFEIDHIKDSTFLFIVTDVQRDTLNNGSNAYKITYRLEYNHEFELVDKVVEHYQAIEVREGTNIKSVVRREDYDIAKLMDNTAVYLKNYFCNLFYNEYVQTFIFEDLTEYRIYDQYMIEFMVRNKILANGEDSYIHVAHIIPTNKTFAIDYDKSVFRAFELKRTDRLLSSDRNVIIDYIENYGSIFDSRFETYYKARYTEASVQGFSTCVIGDEMLYDIIDHKLVPEFLEDEIHPELWKNIIVKYFYDEDITEEEIKSIEYLKFDYSKTAYYTIPLLIFCLEKYIIKTLSK